MQKSILFVCLGNICRSPAADGYLRYLIEKDNLALKVDSAGTSGYHQGEPPHSTMIKEAQKRGLNLSHLKSRKLTSKDYFEFDYIVAMDEQNLEEIKEKAPLNARAKISKLLDHCDLSIKSVPDPYYGGMSGFVECLDIVESGVNGFVNYLKNEKAIK